MKKILKPIRIAFYCLFALNLLAFIGAAIYRAVNSRGMDFDSGLFSGDELEAARVRALRYFNSGDLFVLLRNILIVLTFILICVIAAKILKKFVKKENISRICVMIISIAAAVCLLTFGIIRVTTLVTARYHIEYMVGFVLRPAGTHEMPDALYADLPQREFPACLAVAAESAFSAALSATNEYPEYRHTPNFEIRRICYNNILTGRFLLTFEYEIFSTQRTERRAMRLLVTTERVEGQLTIRDVYYVGSVRLETTPHSAEFLDQMWGQNTAD